MSFSYPYTLLLLFMIPILIMFRKKRKISSKIYLSHMPESFRKDRTVYFKHFSKDLLRFICLFFLIITSARPQLGNTQVKRLTEGLDIMLIVDTSGSMRALDFTFDGERKDRLYVIKKVIDDFVKDRIDDRIGLVVFGSESYIQAPLTLDHGVLETFISHMEIGMAGDGTAIGDAMATSIKRLKDLNSKSKIAILLTDGSNNAGSINPLEAAEAASNLGIKFYTIAIGGKGKVPYPVDGFFGKSVRMVDMKVDRALLKSIADKTGGEYFEASDTQALKKVYTTIDELEKTKVEKKEYRNFKDVAEYFLALSLVFLLAEIFVGFMPWRALP